MEINKIYPPKGKKTGKAATNEFVHSKIEEIRKHKKKEDINIKFNKVLLSNIILGTTLPRDQKERIHTTVNKSQSRCESRVIDYQ